jgi:histidyl-tRNA synthetase
VDKLDRAGESAIVDMLKGLMLDSAVVDQIMGFVKVGGSNDDKLSYVDGVLGNSKATGSIRDILNTLSNYALKGGLAVDFSVMRGLDYYTGVVFEYKGIDDERNSLGGGGRYDNLIGAYAPNSKSMPAVGVSLGIDRILDMLNFSSSMEYTYAKVFVVTVKDSNYTYALRVANLLRSNGIATDINIASRNLANQFSYAGAIKTKYAVIVGDAEEQLGKVKLRDLVTGKEETLGFDEAVEAIKGETDG